MTNIVVHYAEPEGQRYLPVVLNDLLTMVHLGEHDGYYVYEPTNMLLKSPEDGLRYHRSMSAEDMYDGPLDLAPFGRPVVGPLSSDEMWMINPQSYDPTRPTVTTTGYTTGYQGESQPIAAPSSAMRPMSTSAAAAA